MFKLLRQPKYTAALSREDRELDYPALDGRSGVRNTNNTPISCASSDGNLYRVVVPYCSLCYYSLTSHRAVLIAKRGRVQTCCGEFFVWELLYREAQSRSLLVIWLSRDKRQSLLQLEVYYR
nr:hypothetical protein CFP56_78992 [Quercus suber]